MNRFSDIAKSAALFATSLLLTLVVSELALRATGYRPTLADPAMYVAHDHEYLPYRMQPRFEGYYMGQRVRLDADGYRVVPDGTVVAVRGPRPTVLLLGDSVVFGHGLAEADAPAAQLQARLAAKGRPVRVKNVAVSGYTTWNELAALELYLEKHTVDAVVLVYLDNDITFDHNQLRLTDGEFGNLGSGAVHRVTQAMYRTIYLSYLARTGLERVRQLAAAGSAPASQARSPLDLPAFEHSLEGLRRIQALCDAHGIDFQVGIYRDVTWYGDADAVLAYEDRLAGELSRNGINHFVVGSHVETLPLERARIAWNDPHPTAEAVGVFVGDIVEALR